MATEGERACDRSEQRQPRRSTLLRRAPPPARPSTARPLPAVGAAGDSLLRERLAALEPRPWHASGSFDPPAAPTLTFASAEGQRVTLALGAGRADAELAPLLAAASPSPFAKVGKTVVDKQVRDAAELLPPSFESSVALPPKVRAGGGGKRRGGGRSQGAASPPPPCLARMLSHALPG